MTDTTARSLATALAEQLSWHWQTLLRPKLEGLTDEEYLWEPAPGWSVRPAGSPAPGAIQMGSGGHRIDFAFPEPDPPPLTTIAWRMGHLVVGVFGVRAASHFGGPPMSYESHAYAGTAAEALRQLDRAYASWIGGVEALDEAGLARPCGPAEGPYAEFPLSDLVLHINREAIHHGAEILLLRDLYRNRYA
ncbi:DinB family protein [Pseudonocardia yuanmonensis]|uniref:DinB family protein n=1 Tax=Pseudonocardia yuanmonensis TaxID=1095914 RepID=A0ABP8WTF7_9PSEU